MKTCIHECYCGTATHVPHGIGKSGCQREITSNPDKFGSDLETNSPMWLVDGQIITEYTLKFQRGYYEHPCGCWSRFGPDDSSPS